MNVRKECLSYLQTEKIKLSEEFLKHKLITEELFVKIIDFVNIDFEGIPENKIYRCFLEMLKDIIHYAFDNNASKAYMRSFFKRINNKCVLEYLRGLMKGKSVEIKNIINSLINFFVYWQVCDSTRKEIIERIEGCM